MSQKTANMLMVDIRGIGSAMGITGAMAAQSASSIYSALDGAEKLSKKTLETFMKLNVFAGMSAESIDNILLSCVSSHFIQFSLFSLHIFILELF